MQKGKIIKEILGEILFPLEFEFYADKIGAWVFHKKVIKEEEEVLLQILLVRGVSINELILELRSTAYGRGPKRMSSFVPNCKRNSKTYQTEEEFIGIVKEYREIIEKYGIAYLEEMSKATTEERPKKKEYQKFYREYKRIAEEVRKREGIGEEETIEEVIERISDSIIKNGDKKFEDRLNITLELAALYSTQLEKEYDSYWEKSEIQEELYFLKIKRGERVRIVNPIIAIFHSWNREKKEIEQTLYSYLIV